MRRLRSWAWKFTATLALLRSLVVRLGVRSLGHGSALVTRAEQHAQAKWRAHAIFADHTAEAFFERLGYERTSGALRLRHPVNNANLRVFAHRLRRS